MTSLITLIRLLRLGELAGGEQLDERAPVGRTLAVRAPVEQSPDARGLVPGELARRFQVAPGEFLQGGQAVLVVHPELAEPLPEHAELPAGRAGRRRLVFRLRRRRLRTPRRGSPGSPGVRLLPHLASSGPGLVPGDGTPGPGKGVILRRRFLPADDLAGGDASPGRRGRRFGLRG